MPSWRPSIRTARSAPRARAKQPSCRPPARSLTRSTMPWKCGSTLCRSRRRKCSPRCAKNRKGAAMRNFELLEPSSPREASRMLLDHGEEARLLAGGTALLLGLRQRLLTPSHMVYFGAVPGLNGISYDESKGLRIGALARHADVPASAAVRRPYPMLACIA